MKQVKGSLIGDGLLLSGSFVAFAIGAESDYGKLLVNGNELAAGRVLPLPAQSPKISFLEGRRDAGAWQGHVLGFECWSEVVNPGPRPPRRSSVELASGLLGGGANMATAHYLRVPFHGRSWARVLVAPLTGLTTVSFAVYGMQHRSSGNPNMVPLLGTFAAPETTSTPSTAGPLAYPVAVGHVIGGVDLVEPFDELLVAYHCGVEPGVNGADVDVVVGGELGIG